MKSLLAALLLLCWASSAQAAVTLDASGTFLVGNTAGTSASYTGLTVGAVPNRVLVCFISWYSTISSPSVTWNGTSLSLVTTIATTFANVRTSMWVLYNPTSGNQTLSVSWTTSTTYIIDCASFKGASQVTALYGGTNGTGTSSPQTVTCGPVAPGDIAVNDTAEGGGSPSAPTQTSLGSSSTGTNGDLGASYALGAGSNITFQWTQSGGQNYSSICAAIEAQHALGSTGAGP